MPRDSWCPRLWQVTSCTHASFSRASSPEKPLGRAGVWEQWSPLGGKFKGLALCNWPGCPPQSLRCPLGSWPGPGVGGISMHGVRTVFQPATIQIFVTLPCRQLSVTMEGGLTQNCLKAPSKEDTPFSQVQLGSGQHGSDPIFLPLSWLTWAHSPAGSCEPGGRLGLGRSVARLAKRSKVRGWGGLRGGGQGRGLSSTPLSGAPKAEVPGVASVAKTSSQWQLEDQTQHQGDPIKDLPFQTGPRQGADGREKRAGAPIQMAGVPSYGSYRPLPCSLFCVPQALVPHDATGCQ